MKKDNPKFKYTVKASEIAAHLQTVLFELAHDHMRSGDSIYDHINSNFPDDMYTTQMYELLPVLAQLIYLDPSKIYDDRVMVAQKNFRECVRDAFINGMTLMLVPDFS